MIFATDSGWHNVERLKASRVLLGWGRPRSAMSKMSRRLVLITEVIASYRIPVFNTLARRSKLDLHVIFLAETEAKFRQCYVYRDEIRFSYQILPSMRWRVGKQPADQLNKPSPQIIICGG
jgi:hypothetical protein